MVNNERGVELDLINLIGKALKDDRLTYVHNNWVFNPIAAFDGEICWNVHFDTAFKKPYNLLNKESVRKMNSAIDNIFGILMDSGLNIKVVESEILSDENKRAEFMKSKHTIVETAHYAINIHEGMELVNIGGISILDTIGIARQADRLKFSIFDAYKSYLSEIEGAKFRRRRKFYTRGLFRVHVYPNEQYLERVYSLHKEAQESDDMKTFAEELKKIGHLDHTVISCKDYNDSFSLKES